MEANQKRNIQSGERYSHLFPVATNTTATIRKDANVYHTVAFIPKVVQETLSHTNKIAATLKGNSIYETCSNIWRFVYNHIAYKKDKDGYEQIRSPARAWHDRFTGVDCDCYSVFISSVLSNLNITHTLRITKYNHAYFQHIYPVVPTTKGYIIIDCVTEKFDYEVPFSEKKDYPMDLQYLNGFDGSPSLYSDANDLHYMRTGNGMEDLGKIIQQRFSAQRKKPAMASAKNRSAVKEPSRNKKPGAAMPTKKTKGIKKIINKVNKVNPATIALRNGILVSMKLNIKNVAGRLRWTYLSPQDAQKKGIIPEKFQKLIATRQRLENILYKAGGKPENLRKSILSGKGNKDKAVNGLDGFDGMIQYMNEYTPLDQLLGPDIHYSENIEGMEGFGQLGEPITLASIAAASGVIAGIVGMLKQVGDIFQKKSKASADFDEVKNEQADNEPVPGGTSNTQPAMPMTADSMPIVREQMQLPNTTANTNTVSPMYDPPMVKEKIQEDVVRADKGATNSEATVVQDLKPDDKPDSFWDKNKQWLKPTAIGVGGVTILAIAIKMFKGKPGSSPQSRSSPATKSLRGVPKSKRNHRRKPKKTTRKKTAIALR